jgi:hypothetical protein
LGDLTLSPLAVTVIGALLTALSGAVGILWRQNVKERDREIARLEADLHQKNQELAKKDAELEWWQRLTLRATEVADWAAHGYVSGSPPPLGAGERGPGGR